MKYHGALAGFGLMPGLAALAERRADSGAQHHHDGRDHERQRDLAHQQVRHEQHLLAPSPSGSPGAAAAARRRRRPCARARSGSAISKTSSVGTIDVWIV